jgi:hypothetical protein
MIFCLEDGLQCLVSKPILKSKKEDVKYYEKNNRPINDFIRWSNAGTWRTGGR